jgi:hypothetical protein
LWDSPSQRLTDKEVEDFAAQLTQKQQQQAAEDHTETCDLQEILAGIDVTCRG